MLEGVDRGCSTDVSSTVMRSTLVRKGGGGRERWEEGSRGCQIRVMGVSEGVLENVIKACLSRDAQHLITDELTQTWTRTNR